MYDSLHTCILNPIVSFVNSNYRITPVQRIPRYTLLLKELLKHTDEKSPEYATLKQAYTTITQVAEHVNEKMKQDDKKKKLIEIRNHIQGWYGNDELIKPNRYWVMDGELWYRTKGKYRQRHVYLFNNMILIANMRKYCKHFTLEVCIYVCVDDLFLCLGDSNSMGEY